LKWYTQEKVWLSWVNLSTHTLHINEFIVLKCPLWGSASVIWQSYFLWLLLINILKTWACFLFLICKVGYTAMWKFNWRQFCLLPLTSPTFDLVHLLHGCISLLYLWTTNEIHQKTAYYAELPEKQLTFVLQQEPITLTTFS